MKQQIVRRLPPLIGIFGQAPRERACERTWYVWHETRDGLWIVLQDRADQLCLSRCRKRFSAGDHLVRDHAERKDVRPDIRRLALELLGRDVLARCP